MSKQNLGSLGICVGIVGATVFAETSNAAIVFTQDFSSSSTVSSYVGTGTNQFDGIAGSNANMTFSIVGGALKATRAGGLGAISKSTDLASPGPTSLVLSFDVSVTSTGAANTSNPIQFFVGNGFDAATSAPTAGNYDSAFFLTLGDGTASANNNFQVKYPAVNATVFSGTQHVTWVLNHSGSTFNYTAPGGTAETLANDKGDLFIGTTRLFNEVGVSTTSNAPLTDFKVIFGAGSASLTLDNFSIASPIPEPASALSVAAIVGLACKRRRR